MQSIQTPETVSKSAASGPSEPVEAVSVVIYLSLGRGIGNWPYREKTVRHTASREGLF